MVISKPVDIETVTERFLRAVSDYPGIREIWMFERRGEVTFWVISDALDHESELGLFEATNTLYREMPGSHWDMRLLNPAYYPSSHDLRTSIPADARRLTLHSGA